MTHNFEPVNAQIDDKMRINGVYKTDERSDLAAVCFDPDSKKITLAPRSITTVVWESKK